MAKIFPLYHSQSWTSVKEACAALDYIGQNIGNQEESLDNLWYDIASLVFFIERREKEGRPETWWQEKMLLSLVEVPVLLAVVREWKTLEQLLTAQKLSGQHSAGALQDQADALFLNLESIASWSAKYAVADLAVQKKIEAQFEAVQQAYDEALAEVQVLTAIIMPPTPTVPYSIDQVKKIFSTSIKDIEPAQFLASLYALGQMDGEAFDLRRLILEWLATPVIKNKESFEWIEVCVVSLCLSIAYEQFAKLSKVEQAFLLEYYAYRATMLGAPLRQLLAAELRATEWSVDYIRLNNFFLKSLSTTQEFLSNAKTLKALPLADIFVDSVKHKPDVKNVVIKKIYAGTEDAVFVEWMDEIISIFTALCEARLIDWLKEGDVPVREQIRAELAKLYVYFAFGGTFERLVAYFQQERRRISLPFFLKNLSKQADLADPQTIDNCIALASVLQENNLLENKDDIILFDESDNQFHWNEEVLRS